MTLMPRKHTPSSMSSKTRHAHNAPPPDSSTRMPSKTESNGSLLIAHNAKSRSSSITSMPTRNGSRRNWSLNTMGPWLPRTEPTPSEPSTSLAPILVCLSNAVKF